MAKECDISRTLVRTIFETLQKKGIISVDGRKKNWERKPRKSDLYSIKEKPRSLGAKVQDYLLQNFREGVYHAGDSISELEVAKSLNTTTVTVREALLRISKSAFIKKEQRHSWKVF